MRDFLYVDNVHGAPWDDVYKWYSPWIDHVRHRTDLNYVVDIMSGEVAIGHSYVSGGDFPDLDRVPVGLLGCDLEVSNGNYKISKIYNGERWNPGMNAPLAQPGITVNQGDFILAINGKTLSAGSNPYSLLEQTAGREITITVNSKPSMTDAKTVLVKPVSSERGLRTMDWIEGNRRKVDELSTVNWPMFMFQIQDKVVLPLSTVITFLNKIKKELLLTNAIMVAVLPRII